MSSGDAASLPVKEPFVLLFRSGLTLQVPLSLDSTGEEIVEEACKEYGSQLPHTQVLSLPSAVPIGRHDTLRSKNILPGSVLFLNPRFY